MEKNTYYGEAYFKWQGAIGEFGGWANVDKFKAYLSPEKNVVDFGSGGGFLLANINCKDKIGIEINEKARERAKGLGIVSVETPEEIPGGYADLIISNHALEHVFRPLDEIRKLKRILKPEGMIVLVIPCESIRYAYKPNDINYHLYSWSPMSLGNLFNEAGFDVIESKAYRHRWPPFYTSIAKIFGRSVFNLVCRMYARLWTTSYQVRVVARKKA